MTILDFFTRIENYEYILKCELMFSPHIINRGGII